jgi:hypothetical protein
MRFIYLTATLGIALAFPKMSGARLFPRTAGLMDLSEANITFRIFKLSKTAR